MILPSRNAAVLFSALLVTSTTLTAIAEDLEICPAELAAMESCRDTIGENNTDYVTCTSCAEFVEDLNTWENENCGRANRHLCNGINECACNATACGDEIKTYHKCAGAFSLQLFGCPAGCSSGVSISVVAAGVVTAAVASLLALC